MLTAQLCSSSHTTQDSKSENCVTHPVLSLPISITRVKKFFIDPPDLDHTSLRLSTQVILDCINLPTKNITDCIWPGNMAIFTKWGNLEKKLRTENINYPVLFLSTWEIKDCTDYVWRQYSCEFFSQIHKQTLHYHVEKMPEQSEWYYYFFWIEKDYTVKQLSHAKQMKSKDLRQRLDT